jgi:hypothetical protein
MKVLSIPAVALWFNVRLCLCLCLCLAISLSPLSLSMVILGISILTGLMVTNRTLAFRLNSYILAARPDT